MLDLVHLFGRDRNAADYKAGQYLFEQGDDSHEMYVVLKGEVNIVLDGQKIIETIAEGGLFGELALIQPDATRSASAVAASDCRVVTVDRARFIFLIQQTPYFALHIMEVIIQRLRRASF